MAELAEKVDALIKAVGGPSYDKLAAAIRATGGPTISGAYIQQLRTGARHNPTFQNLQALSRYFTKALGIPVTLNYFDPETPVDQPWVDARDEGRVAELERQLEEERQLTARLTDRGIRRIASRYGSADPATQRQILAIVETLSTLQQPDPPDTAPGAAAGDVDDTAGG
jgi:transcriptional regulator with XRE-family HTH domain